MPPRPKRSAAQRATEAITDLAEEANRERESYHAMSSSGSRQPRRSDARISASVTRGPPSSPLDSNSHQPLQLTVKLPSSKLKEATSRGGGASITVNSREKLSGGQILAGKRNRGGRKSYRVSDSDEDDEDEGEDDVEDDEMEVDEDEDDEVEEEDDDEDGMDVDAEGDEYADSDAVPLVPAKTAATIKLSKSGAISKTANSASATGGTTSNAKVPAPQKSAAAQHYLDDDDDELSELDSDVGEPMDLQVEDAEGEEVEEDDEEEVEEEEDAEGEDAEGEDAEGEDAEGEEIEDADADADGDADGDELGSGEEGMSRGETPDLSKMTRRQRARFEEVPQEYMKLSDEVQVKKHFTAEEHAMRRAEMARRRRNLSEKRNEEVKMETINKLLKKQAPKTNRRAAQQGDDASDGEGSRPDVRFVRWVSRKEGSFVAVPEEVMAAPLGAVFKPGGIPTGGRGRMVEEVA